MPGIEPPGAFVVALFYLTSSSIIVTGIVASALLGETGLVGIFLLFGLVLFLGGHK